jgi:hypothetical protein
VLEVVSSGHKLQRQSGPIGWIAFFLRLIEMLYLFGLKIKRVQARGLGIKAAFGLRVLRSHIDQSISCMQPICSIYMIIIRSGAY